MYMYCVPKLPAVVMEMSRNMLLINVDGVRKLRFIGPAWLNGTFCPAVVVPKKPVIGSIWNRCGL